MNQSKYKTAPVSEVICGVTFKEGILNRKNFYLKLIASLVDEYPLYTTQAALVNEELTDYQNNFLANPALSGRILHRLRTNDKTWLIQIQWNKLYLNWVRDDQKDVGEYPGFTYIFEKFNSLLERVLSEVSGDSSDILYNELTYHDRIRWSDYIDSLHDLEKLVNFRLLTLDLNGTQIANFTKVLNARLSELAGFMTFNFVTTTDVTGKQILRLELAIKGGHPEFHYRQWFASAHAKQVELFEKFVRPEILDKWRQ